MAIPMRPTNGNGRHTPPKPKPADNVHRLMPHDRGAEESLLGAMLQSPRAITAAIDAGVTAEHYYAPARGHIHHAILTVHNRGNGVDAITVAAELETAGLLEQCGGLSALVDLQAGTLGPSAATNHAAIITKTAERRDLMRAADALAEAARTGEPTAEILARLAGATPATKGPQPLPVTPVHELLANPPEPKPMLIEGLLAQGEMMVLAAARASYKSWATMSLAMALADGYGRWLDTFTIRKKCRVLVIHGEMDASAAYGRWKLLLGNDTISAGIFDLYGAGRVIIARVRRQEGNETIETARAILPGGLEATIAEVRPDVMLIDPWAAFYGGAENSNDDADAVLNELGELAKRHAMSVIATHHFSKATDQMEAENLWRGASLLADRVHTRVTLQPFYKPVDYKRMSMDRREGRRYATATFLCRTHAIPDDVTLRWSPDDGRFHPWEPGADDGTAAITAEDAIRRADEKRYVKDMVDLTMLIEAAQRMGGGFDSIRQAEMAMNVSWNKARRVLGLGVHVGKLEAIANPRTGEPESWKLIGAEDADEDDGEDLL